jgi:hypothetical protein
MLRDKFISFLYNPETEEYDLSFFIQILKEEERNKGGLFATKFIQNGSYTQVDVQIAI